MKKAIVAIALAGFASSALAAVAGTVHDLSNTGPNKNLNGTLSACQYCHAPHNTNVSISGAPLWNRNNAVSTFTMYTSATLNNPVAATPNANSMTCLSCHDGATDMGATYSGSPGFATPTRITAIAGTTANLGADLRNDHPISVRYPTTSPNYKAINSIVNIKFYTYGAGTGYVECGSCHDPHNFGGTSDLQPFLRVGKSSICTTCHNY